jgi:hypothetical protein
MIEVIEKFETTTDGQQVLAILQVTNPRLKSRTSNSAGLIIEEFAARGATKEVALERVKEAYARSVESRKAVRS